MNLATTSLFYLLAGAAVAAAMTLRFDRLGRGERAFRAASAIFFWPLYLPLLLQPSSPCGARPAPATGAAPMRSCLDPQLDQALEQVEAELDLALGSLDGWSDGVLTRERGRFAELRTAWRQQAARIGELDRLLGQPGFLPGSAVAAAPPPVAAAETARADNIQRLRDIRRRLHDDLVGTLARVRELVTMIHLARYSGAPAARAEELIDQIAAAVAGLTEVAGWRAEPGSGLVSSTCREDANLPLGHVAHVDKSRSLDRSN